MTERKLEKELDRIYKKNEKKIGKQWNSFFREGEKKTAKTEKELQQAREDEDDDEIERLEKQLQKEKEDYIYNNPDYAKMVVATAAAMTVANQAALDYTNSQMPAFYAQTYNTELKKEAVKIGVRFDIVDERAIRIRQQHGDIMLPHKKIRPPKDQRWNTKQINAQVTQGMINGESMEQIADRLLPIMDNNEASAIRNARTLVNGAENAGRQDRYEELQKEGCEIVRVWLATNDDRTRDWHAEMDGQEVGVDEPFVDGLGNEIMFPCDATAEPETVYNCRCSMRAYIKSYNPK